MIKKKRKMNKIKIKRKIKTKRLIHKGKKKVCGII